MKVEIEMAYMFIFFLIKLDRSQGVDLMYR